MIVRDTPRRREIFLILSGSVVPRILPNIIGSALWALLVLVLHRYVVAMPQISIAAMGVFGLSLSLFLGFRNNAAYERWWEARRIWGRMVSDVRSLAQELRIFAGKGADEEFILTRILAFHHLHRAQLRGDEVTETLNHWVGAEAAEVLMRNANPPNAALQDIATRLHEMAEDGRINGFGQRALAERLAAFPIAQAGNERLLTTPLPFVYSLLVWRTTYLYCLLLPFALLDDAGWFEPLVAAVVAYVFFGFAEVTHELEHPFRKQANSVPLSAMCRVMEISVCNALGRDVPPKLEPVNYVLD
ncbi:bestrophin family protein [Ruegeria pomeroyi]|nr:bestrophin family protein [Ruegeria pomeroyi]MCE8544460.1 bestrophin family protein [Ruegeria pomeroyi]MCE8552720.1 bestrophin family protein [Ruegeria pomeroyi]